MRSASCICHVNAPVQGSDDPIIAPPELLADMWSSTHFWGRLQGPGANLRGIFVSLARQTIGRIEVGRDRLTTWDIEAVTTKC